jgi:iron complex outermembrane receptor protein
VGPTLQSFGLKSDKFLPKVALQYDLTPDASAYLQWSRGYKSGGANLPDGGAIAILPPYGSETLDAYEIGVKAQFLEQRLTTNVAAFYYDYADLQITTNIPPSATLVQNADARVYGIEGDFRFEVVDQLALTLAPTWQRATFVDFTTVDPLFGNTLDLDGEPLSRAPRFTMNAGVEGRLDLGHEFFSTLKLQANVMHNSTVVLRYQNQNAVERQEPYTILNLSATLLDASEKTKLTAFLNNVTDELYKQHVDNFGQGYSGNYGPPRTWGIRLSRSF